MSTKLSNRLSGGMADSWDRAPFRQLHAVELYRSGGQNCAAGVQSEEPRKSNCEWSTIISIRFNQICRSRILAVETESVYL